MKKLESNPIARQPLVSQIIYSGKGFAVEICRDKRSLNTAFRLRYQAYLGVDAIPENQEKLLYDDFDFLPNAFVHLVWFNGKPVATIRGCIFAEYYEWSPTEGINYFSKDIKENIGDRTRLLESNRFAVAPDFQGRQSLFAQLLLFRAHALNSSAHQCTHIITSVRSNHISFYRRFLGMEQISREMKYVPWVDVEVALMATTVNQCLAVALKRGMPGVEDEEVRQYAKIAGILVSGNKSSKAA